MNRFIYFLINLFVSVPLFAQHFDIVEEWLPNEDNEPLPVHPVPSAYQMRWMQTEFYAFFHYGINTYTGRQWGLGNEKESVFAPSIPPNTEQWLSVAKSAGMKGGIAVAKHHDGFCLWPTTTTSHSVKRAGSEYGRNFNVVREFSAAARKLGMKYGFYVSPWDRNNEHYGTERYITEVFFPQCIEVAQVGGEQFEMWFDAANGGNGYYGGKNTTIAIDPTHYYDLHNLRDTIHALCPGIIMWGLGGDIRWIGNEDGEAPVTNWLTADRIDGTASSWTAWEGGWAWLPAECDAMTTEGWFWSKKETLKSPERLFQMYLECVGRNATLLLNLAPNSLGEIPPATVGTMKQLGQLLEDRLSHDYVQTAQVKASNTRHAGQMRTYDITHVTDGSRETYWATDDDVKQATITFEWEEPQTLHYVELMEHVNLGQRIKKFSIETSDDGIMWTTRAEDLCTTIGYKRIVPLDGSTSKYGKGIRCRVLRVNIQDVIECPTLERIAIY